MSQIITADGSVLDLYDGAYSGAQIDAAVARALAGGAIDDEIDAMRALIGPPLVAQTAADMTDTGKIYVYTGSESGMINGNWYYWDGTAWVSGGVYNAVAVQTDKTMSVSDMPADAATVGRLALLGYPHIISSTAVLEELVPTRSANDFPINRMVSIGSSTVALVDGVTIGGSKIGLYITVNFDAAYRSGAKQIFVNSYGLATRSYSGGSWSSWLVSATGDDITSAITTEDASIRNDTLTRWPTMITNAASVTAVTGGTDSVDDFPLNRWVYVSASAPAITNEATIGGNRGGLYITLHYAGASASSKSGAVQLYIGRWGGVATRVNASGNWGDWVVIAPNNETVYRVGPTRDYKSLTQLWMDIGEDASPKIVLVDPGEYDVYQEYIDNEVPVPPAGTSTSNYKPYCANIPSNTKVVGQGEVVLRWEPTSSQISEIESQIWSPVNVYGADVSLENLTIIVKNGRYAIHDDPHNDFPGCRHAYRNIRIHRLANDEGLGFGMAVGMGYCDKGIYDFTGLWISNEVDTEHGYCLGGHEGNTGSSAGAYDGATVTISDCVLLAVNLYSMRFQTINTSAQQKIQVCLNNCWLNKAIWLDQNTSSSKQFFALTLLNSGDPDFTIDTDDNPYPVQCYDRDHVALAITQQPTNQAGSPNTKVYFTVTAVGAGLKYRWQYSADGGTTWSNTTFVGYRTDTLQVTATTARNGYQYRCTVSAASGETVVSDAGTLTVTGGSND